MEGIGIVLAALSMFVALAALWFANDMAKRLGAQNRNLIESHIAGLTRRLDEGLKKMQEMEPAIIELEKRTAALANDLPDALEELEAKGQTIDRLRSRLDDLEESVAKLTRPRSNMK